MANPLTNPEDFQEWKEHRLTKAYHQFLLDQVARVSHQWAKRRVLSDQMGHQQSQAETWADLAALECETVRAFYEKDEG